MRVATTMDPLMKNDASMEGFVAELEHIVFLAY